MMDKQTQEKYSDFQITPEYINQWLDSTTVPLDKNSTTIISEAVFQILSSVKEIEQNNRRKRQAKGIVSAKERGVSFGRPKKKTPEDFGEIVRKWEAGYISVSDILDLYGISRSTFFRRLREYRLMCEKEIKP
jgi:DNA invertase Pin-like site-specific DNA recombinase